LGLPEGLVLGDSDGWLCDGALEPFETVVEHFVLRKVKGGTRGKSPPTSVLGFFTGGFFAPLSLFGLLPPVLSSLFVLGGSLDGGARGVRAEMVAYKESNSGLSSVASWTVVGLLPARAVERSAVSIFTRSTMFSCALRLSPLDMRVE
jgi:hypothetical protein